MPSTIEHYATSHPQLGGPLPIAPLLAKQLDALPGDARLLDVGCGEGALLRAIGEREPTFELAGCDLSAHRAAVACSHGLDVVVADCTGLPWPDGYFDLVISRHVIEHVESERAMLDEAVRVLRAGGHLYLETPRRLAGAWYPYRNPSGAFVLDPTHLREYGAAEELTDLFPASNLVLRAVREDAITYELGHLVYRATREMRRRVGRERRSTDRLAGEGPTMAVPVPRYRELQVLAQVVDGS